MYFVFSPYKNSLSMFTFFFKGVCVFRLFSLHDIGLVIFGGDVFCLDFHIVCGFVNTTGHLDSICWLYFVMSF